MRTALFLAAVLLASPGPAAEEGAGAGARTPVLKTRHSGRGPRVVAGQQAARRAAVSFGAYVLRAVAAMPRGGGYSTDDDAMEALSCKALVWDAEAQILRIDPQQAKPTFCSAACYVVLLHALKQWSVANKRPLSPQVWQLMAPALRQPDGLGVWGRANANGPGFARLAADTATGVNFTSPALARPGDFLKFFWSDDIGVDERGHMVVYLGAEKVKDKVCIRYWSANKPDGCGIRSVPLESMHHLIFTRITHPEAFSNIQHLPPSDSLLEQMQQRAFTWQEVVSACRIILPKTRRP